MTHKTDLYDPLQLLFRPTESTGVFRSNDGRSLVEWRPAGPRVGNRPKGVTKAPEKRDGHRL